MRALASTVVLGLAWFAAVNLAAVVVAQVVSLRVPEAVSGSVRRADRLLALRFLPFLCAAAVSLVLFAPAHFRLEPPNPDEEMSLLVAGLAAIGVVLFARAAWSAARILAASATLRIFTRQRREQPGSLRVVDVPLIGGIALAGVLRPTILVGARARAVLTDAELDVAVAHELAHQRARDNVFRTLMRCLPDAFGLTGAGRRVATQWEAEAECLADARAIDGSPARATRLASALVKVARVAATDYRRSYAHGWSSFHHPTLLETRVRRLTEGLPVAVERRWELWALAALLAAGLAAAVAVDVPTALHWFTEEALARLP